jgi:hypothetical protein
MTISNITGPSPHTIGFFDPAALAAIPSGNSGAASAPHLQSPVPTSGGIPPGAFSQCQRATSPIGTEASGTAGAAGALSSDLVSSPWIEWLHVGAVLAVCGLFLGLGLALAGALLRYLGVS